MKNKEKNIVVFSLVAGIVLLVIEFITALITNSQAMLMDALYDSVDTIIVIVTLFLIRIYQKPITEKKPFGYSQLESFFLLIKSFMILALNVNIIVGAIEIIIGGGKDINLNAISISQGILLILNLLTFVIIKRASKKIKSPTLKLEVVAWKSDVVYSASLAISFFLAGFLKGTSLEFLMRYFDQIVVIISGLIMFPDIIKAFKENMTSVLLFAPEDVLANIRKIVSNNLKDTKMKIKHLDVIKTGRKYWVSIYFENSSQFINVNELKEITDKCSKDLNKALGKVYFELVPDVKNYYN